MIPAFTGHRPKKLGGYNIEHPVRQRVRHILSALDIDGAITGGALGVDQDVALTMMDRNIPYVVAAPCRNQSAAWPDASKDLYQEICRGSSPELLAELIKDDETDLYHRHGVIYIHNADYPGPWVMQRRNEWMVDHGDLLFGFWDGTVGGTANCVNYAKAQEKEFINLYSRL